MIICLKKNMAASKYKASTSETSCIYAKYKVTKSTHLRECWILRDKSQSHSICKYEENSHLMRKKEMRNHLMSYDASC